MQDKALGMFLMNKTLIIWYAIPITLGIIIFSILEFIFGHSTLFSFGVGLAVYGLTKYFLYKYYNEIPNIRNVQHD